MSSVDDLMQRAADCAESGDQAGELDSYRRADELGDAAAAILLGNALRKRCDLGPARSAYERAESRGHREAAMSLGNLLWDQGEIDNAKAAFLRSIQLGSVIASLNLGLMLSQAGANDEAMGHLRRAADDGEPGAFWGIGNVREQAGDLEGAAAAYRQGADLHDAGCAFALGMVLYKLGDPPGSRAAFKKAHELGDNRAARILEAFDDEDGGSAALGAPSVSRLWADVGGVYDALASVRNELGRHWIASTLAVQEKHARLAALQVVNKDLRERLSATVSRFKAQPGTSRQGAVAGRLPGPAPNEWLIQQSANRSWTLDPTQLRAFEADLNAGRSALHDAESKTFGGGLRQKGNDALARVATRLDALALATSEASREVVDAEQAREQNARAAALKAHAAFAPAVSRAAASKGQLPTVLQPWTSLSWTTWTVEDRSNVGVRLAYGGVLTPRPDDQLGPNAHFGIDVTVPWGFALHDSWYLKHDGRGRTAAQGFLRSIMIRELLSVSPGEVRFCVFDPVGLGQSAGDLLDLAEYDPDLIGGKVWSSAHDLDARLAELSSHIELVIQKYLRTTYQTIDEFNDAAGEVAEPYRVLVLFDAPTGLSPESVARLKSIVENGPRCGVFTLLAVDSSVQPPHGVDVAQLATAMRVLDLQSGFVENINGYRLEVALDHEVLPERSDIAKRVIDSVGRASIHRTDAAVTLDKVLAMYGAVAARGLSSELGTAATRTRVDDPRTWWTDDSTRGLFAPIGQKGARDVAILGFDSSDHAGALLVGRPGSGKSTLLHSYIGSLCTLYGPDELELYLIDFKEGVEFKAYAEERLPHAKVIAIESDREFGLSVLESLQAEIAQRAQTLRATGGRQAGLQALRQTTGEKIARILLLFDEFQVLFARNDKIGLAAADLLESIIRQGRGFGVHVLLASQSLAGLDALGAHVPQLLPVRILLPSTGSDARKVLGDTNNEGDYLTSHGEGVLNAAGGAVEANERFRGALLPEADRIGRLRAMRDKADALGFTRVPRVFEGNSLVPLDTQAPHPFREELAASGSYRLRLRSGAPMTVGTVGDIVLFREAGANVLTIVRSGETDHGGPGSASGPAYGLLSAAVASAAVTDSALDVIDFMPNDDGLDGLVEPLLDVRRITLRRRRAFPDVLSSYAQEVTDRVDSDEPGRPARILFLFGVHRARDLDSDFGGLDVDSDLVEKLEHVMRDGPEVGVHVWLWADSVAGAARRLTPRMMREVAWRVAGRMSADDSQAYVGNGQAADLRESQLLIVNEDRGVAIRVSAYAPPSPAWMAEFTSTTPDS